MTKLRLYHQILCITLCIGILVISACSTDTNSDLPTVAVLPSATETESVTAVAQQATLPASWTPTATESVTPSPTATPTLTITPSLTITNTPTITYTPSASPTQIPRPILDLVQLAYNATILPDDYEVPFREGVEITPPANAGQDTSVTPINNSGVIIVQTADTGQQYNASLDCPFYPVGGFATAYTADTQTAQLLGCPAGNPPDALQTQVVYQVFERGIMMWVAPNQIYALYSDGTYQRFSDTFDENVDPESGGETPPEGLREPTRGFGKVWRNFAAVKGNLGWAITGEIPDTATTQQFTRGQMIYIPARGDILALIRNTDGGTGTWKSLAGNF